MIAPPSGVRVWLASGVTDMRRGMNGLALQVQQALQRDPHAGDIYVFRGRRGDLLKILWHSRSRKFWVTTRTAAISSFFGGAAVT